VAAEFPVKVPIRAIDRLSSVIDKIKGKFPELASKARQATAAFDTLERSTKKWAGAAEKIGNGLKSVGKTLSVAFTLPAIAGAGYSIKAFADYETALVGVGKTSDIQGAELQKLGQRFLGLTKTLPISATELMGLGQTAAQLGVTGGDNILKFSETLAKLATATNIIGEEGATDLARFLKITGTDLGDVDRVGSALVALGNTSAATEAEILQFSTRLAGATALFGFSASQTLGYAAAMKSLGVEAEAGASSVQRSLGNINEAIAKGGQKAQVLSKITGIPLDKLKETFKTDAAGFLRNFAAGLGKVAERGGDVTQALGYFGMDGVRDIAVIGTLSKKVGELDKAMKTAADGIAENTALNKEFAAAMNTLNSKWEIAKNKINVLFIALGARLAPAVTAVLDAFIGLLDFLDAHPALATTLVVILGILAVLGPLLLALGTLITTVVSAIVFFQTANAILGIFGLTVWGVTIPLLLLIGKILLIIAIVAILGYGIYKLTTWLWGLAGGWDGITAAAGKAWDMISGAYGAMKGMVGLGDAEVKVNQAINPKGQSLTPQGAALGGNEAKSQVNRDFVTQTNNARLDVTVRAPQNTMVRSESNGDFMSLARGPIGIF
jgi:TP901 family phage tail tape measure protein